MNPNNESAEETLLHSTPILKKILEHAEPWGDNPQNLTKAHPNFMEIEKAKKFEENISSYSQRHVQMYYCTPPCKNAYKYAVSFVLQFFAPLKFCLGILYSSEDLALRRQPSRSILRVKCIHRFMGRPKRSSPNGKMGRLLKLLEDIHFFPSRI